MFQHLGKKGSGGGGGGTGDIGVQPDKTRTLYSVKL